jgi:DnaJ-class molecular chaperone
MTTNATRFDDFYGLLGVNASADTEHLRRVWRELVWQHHPDRAGAHAAGRFQKMAEAYAVLSDPTARADYDRRLAAGSDEGAAVAASPIPFRSAPAVRLSRLSGPLSGLIARRIARWVDSQLIELCLDDGEAAVGGMVEISLRVAVRCVRCAGAAGQTCTRCEGSGTVEELFSAWLAVRPGIAEGTLLEPSAWLPEMVERVYFRVRVSGRAVSGQS